MKKEPVISNHEECECQTKCRISFVIKLQYKCSKHQYRKIGSLNECQSQSEQITPEKLREGDKLIKMSIFNRS